MMFDITLQKKQKITHFVKILSKLEKQIISFPYFTKREISGLVDYCDQLSFREAIPLTKTGVVQDFSVCFPAPKIGLMKKCINHFEQIFLDENLKQFFSSSLILNDIAVQKYRAGSNGIGVHRDGNRYRDLILIICLSGSSEFFVANSRDGSNIDVIDDTPGRLVLMSGPGFKNLVNPDNRLFHGVKNVKNGRLSIGLRCNSRFH